MYSYSLTRQGFNMYICHFPSLFIINIYSEFNKDELYFLYSPIHLNFKYYEGVYLQFTPGFIVYYLNMFIIVILTAFLIIS